MVHPIDVDLGNGLLLFYPPSKNSVEALKISLTDMGISSIKRECTSKNPWIPKPEMAVVWFFCYLNSLLTNLLDWATCSMAHVWTKHWPKVMVLDSFVAVVLIFFADVWRSMCASCWCIFWFMVSKRRMTASWAISKSHQKPVGTVRYGLIPWGPVHNPRNGRSKQ